MNVLVPVLFSRESGNDAFRTGNYKQAQILYSIAVFTAPTTYKAPPTPEQQQQEQQQEQQQQQQHTKDEVKDAKKDSGTSSAAERKNSASFSPGDNKIR